MPSSSSPGSNFANPTFSYYCIDPSRDTVGMEWPMRYVDRAYLDRSNDKRSRRLGKQVVDKFGAAYRVEENFAKPDQDAPGMTDSYQS